LVGKRLTVTKNLIDLELPLLAASTLLFLGMVFDGIITIPESALLLVAFAIYFAYSILHSDDTDEHMRKDAFVGEREVVELPSRISRRMFFDPFGILENDIKGIAVKDILLIAIGIIGLALGAKYLIDSVIALSQVLNIATGVIALAAVALGTSLPELLVSVRAAWQKKSEVALGNIFGSNVFNILVVVGLPGLFTPLVVDASTLFLGVPVMIFATFVFIISGISRRIHAYEGAMYLVLYAFFIGKLFGMF
ncbi:MAG: hypothetical protein Q8P16_02100, partial [bacterium]|nr:hypothetical protein [bacterium]